MKRPFASVGIKQSDIPSLVRERFCAKIQKTETCWEWRGSRTPQGYGRFRLHGSSTTAQRVSYAVFVGDLAAGLTVDHLCGNRGCVNPEHLEAVPHRVNILRSNGLAALHVRKTHCDYGHPLAQGKTQRFCPTCKRRNGREWMRRHRAQKAAA